MEFDFSAFRVTNYRKHSHFRMRGWYCKRPNEHYGPCPMMPTFIQKIRNYIKFGHWS